MATSVGLWLDRKQAYLVAVATTHKMNVKQLAAWVRKFYTNGRRNPPGHVRHVRDW